ncbi:arylsulfatase-2 [Coleophoma cylindrospora]|uniref:Arylsulfatase n=1 Tax=Coleophoma cylindrospora TaxID=1849047 RepID=A0A3D8S232_9HELO|nr:arylsulfatase-2 [Coleophoma cylindrospora]
MWWSSLPSLALAASALASVHDQAVLSTDDPHAGPAQPAKQPNVVFFLTDDQDVHLSSLDYMPFVKRHLLDKGTYFSRHYCTTAVCCPSRVTLWTGKAAHNTNITDVNPPYGGYGRFIEQGFNDKYLPVWLQEAGYNTYYTGKLFNVHTLWNYDSPYPAGFTSTDFLLDPGTYNYLNSTFQRNQEKPKNYEGQYSTDVLAEKAYGLLDEAVQADKPFFLTIAPNAPHCNIHMHSYSDDGNQHETDFGPPVAAKRHEHLFEGVKVPRTENFNPDEPSGANWIRDLKKQNQTNLDFNDNFYRKRLQALQAVDEMVDMLFKKLEAYGIMDNTYIVYSTDNGFHIGQHRLQPGKSCGVEEDIHIPLIIRGPGVGENETTDIVTTHTDLAPTFFNILGIPLRTDFDGAAFPITKRGLQDLAVVERKEHVNVEYWGFAGSEGAYGYGPMDSFNNTYKALRVIGPGYNLYYSVWCNNEHELYDMSNDPGQLQNLLHPSQSHQKHKLLNLPIGNVIARLDSLLFVLKSCKGLRCTKPWHTLHPQGDVTTLQDALSVRFDHFYEVEQKRVVFDRCERGYLPESEGPMWEDSGKAFGGMEMFYRGGLHWSEYV